MINFSTYESYIIWTLILIGTDIPIYIALRSIFSKNLTQLDDSVTASAISDFDYLHRSFTNYVDKILSFLTTNLPLH